MEPPPTICCNDFEVSAARNLIFRGIYNFSPVYFLRIYKDI